MAVITSIPAAPATSAKSANGTIPTDQDLSSLLAVHHGDNYTTKSISRVTLPPNALFARLTLPTPAPAPVYTTVQASATSHVELNSDLRYINHSCNPNLIFDMAANEVRVNPLREEGLREGEELTFFYPSTEWAMDRAFECNCGAEDCLGHISGAAAMDERTLLGRYWVSAHVRALKEKQREEKMKKRMSAGGLEALGGKPPLGFRSLAGGGLV